MKGLVDDTVSADERAVLFLHLEGCDDCQRLLETFVAEAMKALQGDEDELAIGAAKKLVAAAGGESVHQAFAGMNQ